MSASGQLQAAGSPGVPGGCRLLGMGMWAGVGIAVVSGAHQLYWHLFCHLPLQMHPMNSGVHGEGQELEGFLFLACLC